MDSNGRTQPLLSGLLIVSVVVCLGFKFALSLQSNAYLTERVTFYPASLIVSHNPKPLTFYENTKLLNVHVVLSFTDFGEKLSMSNHSCSLHDGRFFDEILNSVRDFQKTLSRLLSLPGFFQPRGMRYISAEILSVYDRSALTHVLPPRLLQLDFRMQDMGFKCLPLYLK